MTARRRRSTEPGRLRVAGLVGVSMAVLVGGAAVRGAATPPTLAPLSGTLAASPSASSSAWVCGAAPTTDVDTIALTNTTASPVFGTVTEVGSGAPSAARPVAIAPHSTASINPVRGATGDFVSTLVSLDGGGVAATSVIEADGLWTTSPCVATATSSSYLAGGTTANGADTYLTVTNPTATLAVVNASFVTPTQVLQPLPYQGLVIAPAHSVTLNLGAYVQAQPSFGIAVTATTGRVVASEFEHGAGRVRAISLVEGAPALMDDAVIAGASNVASASTILEVANLSDTPETASLGITLPSGPVASEHLSLGAMTVTDLNLGASSAIPKNFAYAARVTTSGPGVVVARITATSAGEVRTRAVLAGQLAVAGPTVAVVPPAGVGVDRQVGWVGVLCLGDGPLTLSVATMSAGNLVPAPRAPLKLHGGTFVPLEAPTIPTIGRQEAFVVRASGPIASM